MEMAIICLGIGHILAGLLVIAISLPLVRGNISMNQYYGIRFGKSSTSEENWRKINAYGGKQFILWSIPLILFGVTTFFLPFEENRLGIVSVACAPLILVIPAIICYLYSRTLSS